MRRGMGGPGNQLASGRRGRVDAAGLDDERRVHGGRRRALMTDLAQRARRGVVGVLVLVLVRALDDRGDEERKGDGDREQPLDEPGRAGRSAEPARHFRKRAGPRRERTRTPPRSPQTKRVGHGFALRCDADFRAGPLRGTGAEPQSSVTTAACRVEPRDREASCPTKGGTGHSTSNAEARTARVRLKDAAVAARKEATDDDPKERTAGSAGGLDVRACPASLMLRRRWRASTTSPTPTPTPTASVAYSSGRATPDRPRSGPTSTP